jgi:sulfur carrier protein
MKITINGQIKELSAATSLKDVVDQFCKNERGSRRVVTEHNGNIIQHAHWQDTQINDGDTVELVSLVGGG